MGFPQLRTQRPFRFGGLTNYTITAEGGSYAITGADAAVRASRYLSAESTSYTYTGSDVVVEPGLRIVAEGGTYAITGADANLLGTSTPTTLSFSGGLKNKGYPRAFHPSLAKPIRVSTPPLTAFTLTADPGEYSYTGTTASLEVGYAIDAVTSSYSISGADANLLYTGNTVGQIQINDPRRKSKGLPAFHPRGFFSRPPKPIRFAAPSAQNYSLTAEPGEYTIGGNVADIIFNSLPALGHTNKRRSTWPRQFAPTVFGQLRSLSVRRAPAGLNPSQSFTIAILAANYTHTGVAANLRTARKVTAESGSYSYTGTDATLAKSLFQPPAGSYTITGSAASLEVGYKIAIGSGSYALTGTAASPNRAFHIDAGSGTYAITGEDTQEVQPQDKVLVAETGSYTTTGTAITIITDATIPIGTTLEGNVRVETGFSARVTVRTTIEEVVKI